MLQQIRSNSFPASVALISGAFITVLESGDSLSSIRGTFPGEKELIETNLTRNGAAVVSFDPPRLRTVYEISSMNISVPQLRAAVSTAEKSKNTGTIGYTINLMVNGFLVFSESITTGSIVEGVARAPAAQLQVSLPQSIVLSKNDSIEIVVGAFIRFGVIGGTIEALTVEDHGTVEGGQVVKATIIYDQTMSGKKGHN
jgi:hypothetical protein